MAWIGGNRYLSTSESINNAKMVVDYLTGLGWSSEAILGTIVNMDAESGINPQIWEGLTVDTSGGYGLVQWTPATKLIDWCNSSGLDYTDGNAQLERINYESGAGIQWFENGYLPDSRMPDLPYSPPVTFAQYTQLNDAVLATKYWLAYYEHPAWEYMLSRYNSATSDVALWRERLDGYIPHPPTPSGDSNPLPFMMYLRRRFF